MCKEMLVTHCCSLSLYFSERERGGDRGRPNVSVYHRGTVSTLTLTLLNSTLLHLHISSPTLFPSSGLVLTALAWHRTWGDIVRTRSCEESYTKLVCLYRQWGLQCHVTRLWQQSNTEGCVRTWHPPLEPGPPCCYHIISPAWQQLGIWGADEHET